MNLIPAEICRDYFYDNKTLSMLYKIIIFIEAEKKEFEAQRKRIQKEEERLLKGLIKGKSKFIYRKSPFSGDFSCLFYDII